MRMGCHKFETVQEESIGRYLDQVLDRDPLYISVNPLNFTERLASSEEFFVKN